MVDDRTTSFAKTVDLSSYQTNALDRQQRVTPEFAVAASGASDHDTQQMVNQKAQANDGSRPPTFGLQGGPRPPGHVRADADREARAQAARDRAFARMYQELYNEKDNENDITQAENKQKGNDGIER